MSSNFRYLKIASSKRFGFPKSGMGGRSRPHIDDQSILESWFGGGRVCMLLHVSDVCLLGAKKKKRWLTAQIGRAAGRERVDISV